MQHDIDMVLRGWEYKPGMVQARLVQVRNDRQVIQMRVDLGLLQIETSGRPDGQRPHGQTTYLDYLREQARVAKKGGHSFTLSEEQCQESDREFAQYYHRRICWLALRNYTKAVEDADHTLEFMDFAKEHSPSEDYTHAHEQYRGFVIFQRAQAAAALEVEVGDAEAAIDTIRAGLECLRRFFEEYELEDQMEDDGMVQHLRKIESSLREEYHIEETLKEQLERAVADEDYEKAAKLRDALKRRE